MGIRTEQEGPRLGVLGGDDSKHLLRKWGVYPLCRDVAVSGEEAGVVGSEGLTRASDSGEDGRLSADALLSGRDG